MNIENLDVKLYLISVDSMIKKAFEGFEQSKTKESKDRFLQLCADLQIRKTKFLIETGFLPKNGIKI